MSYLKKGNNMSSKQLVPPKRDIKQIEVQNSRRQNIHPMEVDEEANKFPYNPNFGYKKNSY